MTPTEQRIAIAKACGWQIIDYRPGDFIPPRELIEHKTVYWDPERKWKSYPELPNYLSDLNAMHEAEKTCLLKFGQQDTYANWLDSLCYPRQECFATAAQRAEAFLRTFNLWTHD